MVLEILASLSGALTVYLTVRKSIWCWPVGLVNVVLSAVVYMGQQLPAEALLQIFYGGMALYGWLNWSGVISKQKQVPPITRSSAVLLWMASLAALMAGLLLGSFFYTYTHSYVSYADAMLTTFSLAANYLSAQKKIENWYFWLIINSGSVVLYLTKDMYAFAVLFILYFLLALRGLSSWRADVTD